MEEGGIIVVRFVGEANLPGICLKYYVYGSHRDGYGISISEVGAESVKLFVSSHYSPVLRLAEKLRRCSVFPENLQEILEDLQVERTESSPIRLPASNIS